MLVVKNLIKSYKKDVNVLKGISFKVNSGDIFAFIGHNGAGKTTAIKCISGILNFNQGEIIINNINLKENPIECKKHIAYVPDNPDIYPFMTGIEYINFILDIYKIDKKDKLDQIKLLAEKFEIYNNLNAKTNEYSHGMKQKLVLLSAFIRDAKLLIMDEPFVGLDPKATKIIKDMMKDFCKNGGAIFFSTHVLDTAEKLCNKVAILKNGEIVEIGSMKKIIGSTSLEETFLKEDK